MELNGTTFVLEIINFLVLLWILKRFLYRPVLGVVAARRAALAKEQESAKALHGQAEAERAQYERRLSEWEAERQRARAALQDQLAAERAGLMAALERDLAAERQRAAALERRQQEEQARRAEEAALEQGARFAARLLSRVANQELEGKLIDMALEDLQAQAAQAALRAALAEQPGPAQVELRSAYPLQAPQRERLEQMVKTVLGQQVVCSFVQDPELGAGLRITLGDRVLSANLHDELALFRGAA